MWKKCKGGSGRRVGVRSKEVCEFMVECNKDITKRWENLKIIKQEWLMKRLNKVRLLRKA